MRRRAIVVAASLAAILIAIVLVVGAAIRRGFSVHDEPTALESMLARRMRAWAVPADLAGAKNPVPLTPQVLAEARAHFADHCATCHGNDGKGATPIGAKLYPRAPDMTRAATQDLSDGALFAIIENGIRLTGMPGWGTGTAASAYGSWTLVHFIRHIPRMTPEEIREMERLNPVSRPAVPEPAQDSPGTGDSGTGGAAHSAAPHVH